MRFLSTTVIASLLVFALPTTAREHLVFYEISRWDTEATHTENTGSPSNNDKGGSESTGDLEGPVGGFTTVTTGSRRGQRLSYQTFEEDGFYLGVGTQRGSGEYDSCILDDCTPIELSVDEVNLELGWSRNKWTPFLDFMWSDTQSDTPDVTDAHTDWVLGIGTWFAVNEYTKAKFNIKGLRDNDSQTITAGFHHKLQNDITVGAFGSLPITQDVSGFGIRLTIGRNL